MPDTLPLATPSATRSRLRVAMHLQEIEGNPLDTEQVAMFEMFERENWSPEQCLAHIRARAEALAAE